MDDYTQVLVAVADNVGSNQLQNIRQGLKRSIRMHSEKTGVQVWVATEAYSVLSVVLPSHSPDARASWFLGFQRVSCLVKP